VLDAFLQVLKNERSQLGLPEFTGPFSMEIFNQQRPAQGFAAQFDSAFLVGGEHDYQGQ